jgi:proline iminopeptidase
VASGAPPRGEAAPTGFKRDAPFDWRAVIAASQALPPGGIDDHEAVEIGGIKQWISVRGTNPDNPILLFLHGGPGSPMMAESWTFQRPWEDFFTVVQWDQRGAGQTFSQAGRKPDPKLSIDQMQQDAEQLIVYLEHRYHKRKIFLLGHSWGSVLGMRVAQHRPDLLFAYIGVGQVVNVIKNETVGYALTLQEARKAQNPTAIKELEGLAPYPGPPSAETAGKVATERRWDSYFRGMVYARPDDDELSRWTMSPLYSAYDVESAQLGEAATVDALAGDLFGVDFDGVRSIACPFFLFAGAHDRTTPTVLAKAFFDQVQAPEKRYFEIPNASHYVVSEAPGAVLLDLVRYARPVADR